MYSGVRIPLRAYGRRQFDRLGNKEEAVARLKEAANVDLVGLMLAMDDKPSDEKLAEFCEAQVRGCLVDAAIAKITGPPGERRVAMGYARRWADFAEAYSQDS